MLFRYYGGAGYATDFIVIFKGINNSLEPAVGENDIIIRADYIFPFSYLVGNIHLGYQATLFDFPLYGEVFFIAKNDIFSVVR